MLCLEFLQEQFGFLGHGLKQAAPQTRAGIALGGTGGHGAGDLTSVRRKQLSRSLKSSMALSQIPSSCAFLAMWLRAMAGNACSQSLTVSAVSFLQVYMSCNSKTIPAHEALHRSV